MKSIITIIVVQVAMSIFSQTVKQVTIKDFKPAFGEWQGNLTYIDYRSNQPYTMPAYCNIKANNSNSQQLIIEIKYPNEPKANGYDTITFSKDGQYIGKAKVMTKMQLPNSILQIITEEKGIDGNDNKPAILKHTYLIGKSIYSNTKDVKFDGTSVWLKRNEYSFNR